MATAAKLSPSADTVFGNKKVKVRTVTFSSSYATGGESLTAANVGLKRIEVAIAHGPFRKTDATDAVFGSYDHTNNKLAAYRQKDPGATGGADIALPEVGSGTDLSGYSGRMIFIGY